VARFVATGYYDLSSLYTSYIGIHKKGLVESQRPMDHGVRVLELVQDREVSAVLDKWNSAKSLLHKVGERLKELPAKAEVINAYIRAFAPGAYMDWHEEDVIDPEGFGRIHCLLNPSPAFRLYSGEEMLTPQAWYSVAVDHRGLISASNFNAPNTAHELVLETAVGVEG
jgi:hypothetical protein